MALRGVVALSLLAGTCHGHGQITWPPSTRHGGNIHLGADCGRGECYWFSNNVEVGAPTLPTAMRSMEPDVDGGKYDVYRTSPWRAPGKAAVYGSGCGIAGGHPTSTYANGGTPPKGVVVGTDGFTLPKIAKDAAAASLGPAKWVRGGVAEVAWAMSANHAGGYAYRLCKADGVVNEKCFQKNHLAFAGNTSFVVYPNGTRYPLFRAVTAEGTYPAGSQWARDGVPTCRECDKAYDRCGSPLTPVPGLDYGTQWNQQVNCYAECSGSVASKVAGHCPGKTQFSPTDALAGSHAVSGFGKVVWDWSVLDEVAVPADLALGDYVLSWRWDCEESTQVWQNCADITVVTTAAEAAWDTASPAAIALVPNPGPVSSPAAKDPIAATTATTKDPNAAATAFDKNAAGINANVKGCTGWVEFCVGKDVIKGQCGATEADTLAMCEAYNQAVAAKASDSKTTTTAATAAKSSSTSLGANVLYLAVSGAALLLL